MRRSLVLSMLLAALAAAPAAAAPVAGAQFRYWSFSDDEAMRDVIAYFAPGPIHVQLEYWDFERGEDQFRPEVGLTYRDPRRSSYDVAWRHERHAERFFLETGQVIGKRWVARAAVSPIFADYETLVVGEAGADVYWHSYSFAGVTVIRDPREGGLWVVPRARALRERVERLVPGHGRPGQPPDDRLGGRREAAIRAARGRAQQPLRLHDARQRDLHRRRRVSPAREAVAPRFGACAARARVRAAPVRGAPEGGAG